MPWPAYALAALAVVAPQLLGGATGPSALAILVLSTIACSLSAWWLRERSTASLGRTPLLGLAALAAALWTALQALPLPCAWVNWAQPERHALAQRLLALGALEREVCAISAAPGATWAAFGTASALAALFLAGNALSRAGGREVLLHGVALSALAMALVAVGHWVLGAEQVFGVFEVPVNRNTRLLIAPLINENHLAGLLALGFPACVAVAAAQSRVDTRIAWASAALVVFITGVLALSRGGVAALMLGATLFGTSMLLRRRRGARRGPANRAIALGIAACLALGSYVGLAPYEREFAGDTAVPSKLALIAELSELTLLHPLVGVGRGAFGDVSPRALLVDGRAMYPESLPVQWLTEWGWPFSILLAVALAISLGRWWLRNPRTGELALGCGVIALGLQNLVDFSLELPGVAVVASIALGAASNGRGIALPPVLTWSARSGMQLGAALAALATMAAAPWLTVWDRSTLARSLERAAEDEPAAVASMLPSAFRGYPLEPAFVTSATWAAAKVRAASTGRWLNLAMEVAPGWAGPHLVAGQLLEARGAVSQAALELGMALARARALAAPHACGLLQRHPDPELALAMTEEVASDKQQLLEFLVHCLPQGSSARLTLARELLERYPSSILGQRLLVADAERQGEGERALELARAMRAREPSSPEALATLAQLLLARKEPEQALGVLEAFPGPRTGQLLSLERDAALALGDRDRFQRVLEKDLQLHGKSAKARAGIHRGAASKLARSGDFMAALPHAQAAYDLTNDPSELEQVHLIAIRAGMLPVALRTASQLCQLRHREQKYCGTSQGR